jgi:hypothetical protein
VQRWQVFTRNTPENPTQASALEAVRSFMGTLPDFGVPESEIGTVRVVLVSRVPIALELPELARAEFTPDAGPGPGLFILLEWTYLGGAREIAWPYQAVPRMSLAEGFERCIENATTTVERVWSPVGAGAASSGGTVVRPVEPGFFEELASDVQRTTGFVVPLLAFAAVGVGLLALNTRKVRR